MSLLTDNNELYRFLIANNVQGSLLKEFVSKELWKPALVCCDKAIANAESSLLALHNLQELLAEKALTEELYKEELNS